MNKTRWWILNQLGNLCYRLNGGLDKVNNHSLLDRMAINFWAVAFGIEDKMLRQEFPADSHTDKGGGREERKWT